MTSCNASGKRLNDQLNKMKLVLGPLKLYSTNHFYSAYLNIIKNECFGSRQMTSSVISGMKLSASDSVMVAGPAKMWRNC